MHKLYIDIGNSFIKVAALQGMDWVVLYRGQTGDEKVFYEWLEQQPEAELVVCSVVRHITAELEHLLSGEQLIVLSRKSIPGRLIDYKTPKTLGMDRFLPCFGAVHQVPGAVVVIDAGSACTMDYMGGDSIYRGGVIMPGFKLLRQSLNRDLPSLPQVDDLLPDEWPGKSTMDSLRWGSTGLIIGAMDRFITKFEESYGAFSIFLTGGDATSVYHYLQTGDFRNVTDIKIRPNLLFEGMQSFLDESE